MKKISLILSVVILLGTLFSTPAYAYIDELKTEINGIDFYYRVIDGMYVEILEGSKFIPTEIDGLPVTIIGRDAFRGHYNVEDDGGYDVNHWTIPNTVTYIGDGAFQSNPEIGSIEIPSSVTYIGKSAFESCVYLKKITIPKSVKKIEAYTFFECRSLKKITLHDDIYEIGDYAFFGCRLLSKFDIPSELETLGDRAFYYCSSLKSLDFSGSYPTVGYQSMGFYTTYTPYDARLYNPWMILPDEKNKKYKNFKIITNQINYGYSEGSPGEYADKNGFEYLVISSSKKTNLGKGRAGDARTLYIDSKRLTDYKTLNPEIVKVTKKGKLIALKKGEAVVKVTLPSGKVYRGLFTVTNNPVLEQKIKKGNTVDYKRTKTVSVKMGKTVTFKIYGKAKSINNKYTSTSKAKIISKKNASTIKIKGIAKGTSTVKVKVNGVKTLKLKVNVK